MAGDVEVLSRVRLGRALAHLGVLMLGNGIGVCALGLGPLTSFATGSIGYALVGVAIGVPLLWFGSHAWPLLGSLLLRSRAGVFVEGDELVYLQRRHAAMPVAAIRLIGRMDKSGVLLEGVGGAHLEISSELMEESPAELARRIKGLSPKARVAIGDKFWRRARAL